MGWGEASPAGDSGTEPVPADEIGSVSRGEASPVNGSGGERVSKSVNGYVDQVASWDASPLPAGWEWKSLEVVLKIRSGSVDPRKHPSEMFDLYSIPAYDAGMELEVSAGRDIGSSKKVVQPQDCLLSRLNPRIPRVWIVGSSTGRRQISSTEFIPLIDRLRPSGEPWFDPYFLRYMLLSPGFRDQVAHQVMGATGSRQRLKREDINAATLPVPPLDEQRRIVARIEALFDRVEEARRLRVAAGEDAEQLMPATLAEILDVTKSQHMCQTIGDLVEAGVLQIIGGGTPSKKHQAFWSGTIPWVSPKDMKRWIIDDTEDHITSEAVDRSSAKLITQGAVLVVVRGMILARTWPVAIAGAALTVNQDMKALCPSNGLLPEYLGYALRGSEAEVLSRVETAAHGTKRLKTETLEAVEIPIPPAPEQRRIVDYLDGVQAQVGELKRLQATSAAELERLGGAVLARAFRGEL